MIEQGHLTAIVGAIVAILLQVVLAAHIPLFGAVPNFLVVFTMALAVTRPHGFGPVLPFVLGLFYDLFTGGPVGAMAFSLTAFSYIAATFFAAADNDTLFVPIVTLAIGVFLVDLSYAMFLLLFGYPAGFVEALTYRVLPCFVYDFVLAFVLLLVLRRSSTPRASGTPSITQLR